MTKDVENTLTWDLLGPPYLPEFTPPSWCELSSGSLSFLEAGRYLVSVSADFQSAGTFTSAQFKWFENEDNAGGQLVKSSSFSWIAWVVVSSEANPYPSSSAYQPAVMPRLWIAPNTPWVIKVTPTCTLNPAFAGDLTVLRLA